MNVRRAPTTGSERVVQAKDGDVLKVSASTQGPSYCWLKVPDGWMAQTGWVQSTMPAVQLPKIEGKADFVGQIKAALDYLKRESPHWYLYVVRPTRHIKARPSYENNSVAYGEHDRIEIARGHLESTLLLASALVHEACHLYQWDGGQRIVSGDDEGRTKAEIECYSVELEMVRDIKPGDELIRGINAQLNAIRRDGWSARPTPSLWPWR